MPPTGGMAPPPPRKLLDDQLFLIFLAPPAPPLFSSSPAPIQQQTPSRQPKPTQAPVSSAPQDLLSQIRLGTKLKSASETQMEPVPSKASTGDDLADALKNALQSRLTAVQGGSDDDEEDDDDEW